MTTARGDSNPYDGVLGAGGKFRKRQLRTTKTTPYDRPPTSIRNPSGTGNRNGWLSKLVDPARRLITSSAHRLFASVFMKRLPPHQTPQLLNSENNEEPRENQPEVTSAVPPVVQGAIVGCGSPIKNTEESGVAELEEILKKKTFTRQDDLKLHLIDAKLKCMVTSATFFINVYMILYKMLLFFRSDVISMVSHDKKEEFPKTPFRGNVTENHFVSTPVVRSTVVDEVVSAPAELAKAYMGSRTTKTFVSRPGLQNQVSRGDLTFQSNKIFPSTSSTMSLMPRSSGHVGSLRNSFVTPRSRGRSAIYSMARTPCSRVNSAITLKSSGTASDVFGGPSSSQSAWEQNRISGCRNGVLKRRNSVLDNDIGSVGPIRRIRQKSNFSSITFSVPASAGPLSAHVGVNSSAGLGSLAENGDNITARSSFTTVPSNSSQVASKILQLDMSVSPGEKVPTNLLPSMLHGQALKSLETVDTSKFLENMHDNDELNGSCTALTGFQDSISHKHDMVKENGSTLLVGLPDKSVPAVTGARTNSLMKDNNVPSVSAAGSSVIKSVLQQPQLKSQAFQMSAHEDYLDDDDDYPNGSTQAEGRGRLDKCVTGTKSAASEAIEKPSRLSEVEPISSAAFSQKPDLKRPDESTSTEKNAGITFPVVKMAISSVQSAFVVSPSTPTANKEAISSHSNAPYMHRIGEEVSAAKQSNVAVTTYGFASTHGGDFSLVTGSSGVKLATISDKKLENSSSFATTAHGTTNHLSDKTEKENNLNEIFCRKPEAAITSSVSTSTSAGSIFEFGASKDSSTLNNGSLASSPFSFASPAPLCVPSVGQIPSSAAATNSDASVAVTTAASSTANATISCIGNPSAEASIHSFAPVFKFSSSRDPSTSVSTLSATLGEVTKSKTQDTSLGSVGIFPFGGASAFTSSGSSIFGGTSEVKSAASNTTGTTAEVASTGNSSFSGLSSAITNSASGFFSNTFSTVTSTGNGILGGTSATTSIGNGILGGTSTTSTGNGIFGGTPATTGTGCSTFGGTSLAIDGTGSGIFSTKSAVMSTGSSIFGFSAPAASTSTTQTQGLNPFNAVNTQASSVGTGIGSSTQSMPIQFSSSASSPSFGLGGNTTFFSGSSMFGSSASNTKPFCSGATFESSSSSSETNTLSSSSGITSGAFGSNWQAPKTPIFGSSSSGFSFGSSPSVSAPSSAPSVFGSSTGASSSSIFSFTSAVAATTSQHVFGNTSSRLVFGSTPSTHNDQMEDSMAEDTVQASPTVAPFQQEISPPASGFIFGSSNPSGLGGSFQFGSQPSIAAPQNPSPFLASGSLELGAEGSFSLGTSGGDKSGRKYVKARRQRKK
ncbi:nuclear pore complex protein NUP1-like [Hibiscus syriacus]|uniref:nuclear pore complex protein NUP1-like n=1 Tax=Hibiscus syriacus TaxID=106335 RepID=UPI0019206492|nr:nuclear pore complex protein NUP1-like [Hibiscus syriacus]